MTVYYAPRRRDPNAGLEYYMLQMAQLIGNKRTAGKEREKVKSFAESISPPDITTINDQRLFSPAGQQIAQDAWLGGDPNLSAALGTRPGQQTLSPQQILQKALSSGIDPSQALQLSQLGQPATSLTKEERDKAERIEAGLLSRATQPKLTEPYKKTPEEIQRDRDITFLGKGEGKPFQDREAEERLKALPPGNLIQLTPASKRFDNLFSKLTRSFIGQIKPTATRKTEKFPEGRTDKIFGQADFETLVVESIKEGLKEGIDPASMSVSVLEWWTRQFEKAKDKAFQKFQNPAEFQQIGEPAGLEQSLEQIIQQPATADELKKLGTREAYEQGKKLGYWQ